jgi:2-dehydro-3-deoxygalactonokinase
MRAAKFIAGDWGTSNLRLFLCDAEGAALDAISGPGAADSSGRFAPVFGSLTARWKESHGVLPAVLCGMVGSSLGWTQAPYLPCPARPACASRGYDTSQVDGDAASLNGLLQVHRLLSRGVTGT